MFPATPPAERPLLAFCLCALLSAPAAGLEVRGHLKTRLLGVDTAPHSPGRLRRRMENSFRVSALWSGGGRQAEAAYQLDPALAERPAASFGGLSGAGENTGYRFSDLGGALFTGDDGGVRGYQNLDRAFVTFSPPSGDIYAGRQPIAFGAADLVNPTDVLAPYPFGVLDTENRAGVDALRYRAPLGDLGEIDSGVVCGRGCSRSRSAAFARLKMSAGVDITAIAAAFRDNVLLGGDLSGAVGGTGLKLEAAHVVSGGISGRRSKEDFVRLSAVAERNFSAGGGLLAFLEYHYNGAGEAGPGDYLSAAGNKAYRDAGGYLAGRHYFGPGLSFRPGPLLSAAASALINAGDGSFYAAPRLEYNPAQNLYAGAGALIPSGAGSPEKAAAPSSEFGSYGAVYYVSLGFYF